MDDLTGFMIGTYMIVDTLAEGTTADSFLARDDKGKKVVVKRLFPYLADDARVVGGFLNSLQTSALVKMGRHIAKTVSTKRLPEGVFLVREYAEGQPFANLISGQVAVDFDQRRAALDICDAVRALSRAGIVHGGIHPNNLIVQNDGRIKITDFGISRHALTGKVSASYPRNALRYLSPEQVNGEEATASSDIYSVGMVIWALNERCDRIGALDFEGIVNGIKAGVRPSCPILATAVDREPKRRFATIVELSDRLANNRNGETTSTNEKASESAHADRSTASSASIDCAGKSKNEAKTAKSGTGNRQGETQIGEAKEEIGKSQPENREKTFDPDGSNDTKRDRSYQPKINSSADKKFGRLTSAYDVLGKTQLLGDGPPKSVQIQIAGAVQRPLQLTNGGEGPLDLAAKCFGSGVHVNPSKINIPPGKMASVIVKLDASSRFAKLQLCWNESEEQCVVVHIARAL